MRCYLLGGLHGWNSGNFENSDMCDLCRAAYNSTQYCKCGMYNSTAICAECMLCHQFSVNIICYNLPPSLKYIVLHSLRGSQSERITNLPYYIVNIEFHPLVVICGNPSYSKNYKILMQPYSIPLNSIGISTFINMYNYTILSHVIAEPGTAFYISPKCDMYNRKYSQCLCNDSNSSCCSCIYQYDYAGDYLPITITWFNNIGIIVRPCTPPCNPIILIRNDNLPSRLYRLVNFLINYVGYISTTNAATDALIDTIDKIMTINNGSNGRAAQLIDTTMLYHFLNKVISTLDFNTRNLPLLTNTV